MLNRLLRWSALESLAARWSLGPPLVEAIGELV